MLFVQWAVIMCSTHVCQKYYLQYFSSVKNNLHVFSVFPAKPLETNDTATVGSLRVCFEVQPLCRSASYTIIVFFGVQTIDGNCDYSDNVNRTFSDVMPGNSQCLEVDSTDLELSTDEYCYNVSLIGDAGLLDGKFISEQLVFPVTVNVTVLTHSGHW